MKSIITKILSFRRKQIYMDYASTTPVLPIVKREMDKYWSKDFYNPSSLYREGVYLKNKIKKFKKEIADNLSCSKDGIYFTSSGTESNNLAILGLRDEKGKTEGKHIITSKIEHPSILEALKEFESLGGEVTYLSVNKEGLINPKEVFQSIKKETVLVSIMMVNNEIGTIQQLKDISKAIRKAEKKLNTKVYFHTDASQALNYEKIDILRMGLDMVTLDSQKIYGPKGIGLLYVDPKINLRPIIFGGGQEKGLRSSTEPMPLIAGFKKAIEIASIDRKKEGDRVKKIREYGIEKILKEFPKAKLNGSRDRRIANNINICFPGIDSEYVVIRLDYAGIKCSYASSCKSLGDSLSSYVIDEIDKGCGTSSLRFTLGRGSKKEDTDILIRELKKIIKLDII